MIGYKIVRSSATTYTGVVLDIKASVVKDYLREYTVIGKENKPGSPIKSW